MIKKRWSELNSEQKQKFEKHNGLVPTQHSYYAATQQI